MSTSAKVTARQRIENLLDDNSFVEIGAYVKARNTDFNIHAKDTPSDGVITGYGVINGGLVYVYSQDAVSTWRFCRQKCTLKKLQFFTIWQ